METVTTIIPIFAVILIGWIARRNRFIPPEFLEPANRLVFYVAIPAMIFRAISGASMKAHLVPVVLAITCGSILFVFALSWIIGSQLPIRHRQRGTFIQNSIHGNLGYIGLAVAYYFLDAEGFTRASIIAGFMMILQNFLSVTVLQVFAEHPSGDRSRWIIFIRILGNPIILSAIAGMIFSVAGIPLPVVIDRSLKILGGMALPLALLIIGASLSIELIRMRIYPVLFTSSMKLGLLPAAGFFMFRFAGIPAREYIPALIMLAAPTATVTYVMAREMKGDTEFAVAAISLSTLLSAVTFALWLNLG